MEEDQLNSFLNRLVAQIDQMTERQQQLEQMVSNAGQGEGARPLADEKLAGQLATMDETLAQLKATVFNMQQQPQPIQQTATFVLKEFRMTSTPAPEFDGLIRTKAPHEAQAIIDDYLHKSERAAFMNKFRADGQPDLYLNHRTYVDYISMGLKGIALKKWRRMPQGTRDMMTWSAYKHWIRTSFSSPLSFSNAVRTLNNIRQVKSAAAYTERFNELVEAIRANNVILDEKILVTTYLDGLKPHLHRQHDLFAIKNLEDLQTAAERLDEYYFNKSKEDRNDNHQSFRSNKKPSPIVKDDPMELDNVEGKKRSFRRLTEDERRTYDRNGWCKFCRSKEHRTNDCTHPSFNRNRYNNYESEAKRRRDGADAEDTAGGSGSGSN